MPIPLAIPARPASPSVAARRDRASQVAPAPTSAIRAAPSTWIPSSVRMLSRGVSPPTSPAAPCPVVCTATRSPSAPAMRTAWAISLALDGATTTAGSCVAVRFHAAAKR